MAHLLRRAFLAFILSASGWLVVGAALPAWSQAPPKPDQRLSAYDLEQRAGEHFVADRLEEALKDFNSALALEPRRLSAICGRAETLHALMRLDEALADCELALRIQPNSAYARFVRASVRNDQGDPHKAIEDFNESIRLEPSNPLAFNNRGIAYAKLGQLNRAVVDFGVAIRLHPRHATAYFNRGFARQHQGEYRKGLADYRRALGLGADEAVARNAIAWVLATCPDSRVRDGAGAVLHAQLACELDNFQKWEYVDTLAAAHAAAGDFEQAVAMARKTIEMAPDDMHSELQRRLGLFQAGKIYSPAEPEATPSSP